MKTLTKSIFYKFSGTLFLFSFFQIIAMGQGNSESNITSTIIGRYRWYTQPWAVVTGIALILIIIVLLVPSEAPNNTSRTEKVPYFKSNESEHSK